MGTVEKLSQRLEKATPLPLARLVYLASLRDYNTDRYSHAGWAFELTEEGADQALRQAHEEEFRRFVPRTVAEVAEELESYFDTLLEPVGTMVSVWREVESFRALAPRGSHPVDRDLFFSTVRAALAVLADRVPLPSPPPRSASPRLSPDQ